MYAIIKPFKHPGRTTKAERIWGAITVAGTFTTNKTRMRSYSDKDVAEKESRNHPKSKVVCLHIAEQRLSAQ